MILIGWIFIIVVAGASFYLVIWVILASLSVILGLGGANPKTTRWGRLVQSFRQNFLYRPRGIVAVLLLGVLYALFVLAVNL